MRAQWLLAAILTTFGFGASYADRVAPTANEQQMAQSLPDEHPAEALSCRPQGAGCKVMNGKNPEPDNNLCCSGHCNWDNGSQSYLCD